MINTKNLTATSLRLALVCSMFAIALLTSAALYFTYGMLKNFAVETSHAQVDSIASQDTVQTLQKVQQELTKDKDIVTRAGNIVADSQSYLYQNQIINDLNTFASKSGISITNIDFGTTSTPGSSPTQPTTPTTPAPPGLTATTVSVTLSNPVAYDNMLRFIHAIEQNLTKMQISKVGLAKGSEGNSITSEVLTIQVYIKKG